MNNTNTTTYSYNSNLDFAFDKAADEIIGYIRMTFIKSNNIPVKDDIKSDIIQIIKRNVVGNDINITIVND